MRKAFGVSGANAESKRERRAAAHQRAALPQRRPLQKHLAHLQLHPVPSRPTVVAIDCWRARRDSKKKKKSTGQVSSSQRCVEPRRSSARTGCSAAVPTPSSQILQRRGGGWSCWCQHWTGAPTLAILRRTGAAPWRSTQCETT